MSKWTATRIKAAKGQHKIVSLTASDFSMARIADEAGIQLILVGDSLAMTVLGYENTLPVTMEEMLHHTAAVVRGTKNALVVADMPFMSYQASIEEAVENAGRFMKTAGAGGVKIEGGAFRAPLVKTLVENGIPVFGHIGLTPQSVHETGGYKVQGKDEKSATQLREDATALQDAGAFAVVLECVPASLSGQITASLDIPTIGIGAGPACDGQILVSYDLLGLFTDQAPRFVRKYADLGTEMKKAFISYRGEVEDGIFPSDEHSY